MLKRILHTVLSLWLATLLVFGQTPKEFLHLFAHHTDTVHQDRQRVAYDVQHHHCGYISLTLLPFDAGYQMPVCYLALRVPVYTTYLLPGDKDVVLYRARVASLRGPPVA